VTTGCCTEVVATGASHPVRALGDVLAIARAAAKDPAMQDGDATGGGSWGGNSGSSGSRDNAAAPRGELGA